MACALLCLRVYKNKKLPATNYQLQTRLFILCILKVTNAENSSLQVMKMDRPQYTLTRLDRMSQEEFTAALGEIWEETPAIANRAWHNRPFEDVEALYRAMVAVVESMSETQQLDLIKAHPDLGSKAKMAQASVEEQSGVGLDRLSESEYERFQSFNQAYKDKFGFPFIVAVKYHTKESILDAFETRLQNGQEEEIQQALTEISKIARLRLEALVEK